MSLDNRILVVSTEESKYKAMCGSDMAIAISGDITNECAALHLQTICLNYQSSVQSYFTSLYGQWENDINIAGNGEVFPEKWTGKGGDAFPSNIADTLCSWVLDPRLRFLTLQRLAHIVPSLLPKS
jgi:lipid A disaccharide synthetase